MPRNPLIGRDREISAIQQFILQEHVGLLTLTGPGGIGKTRLALQVAVNLLDHFVDGVYFVSLAPLREPELVGAAIAQALGVREVPEYTLQETLQQYLQDKYQLLVLDNFEQILSAAPLVSALLTQCRRLKVVVTSRAPLRLYGEQEYAVPPLALPASGSRFEVVDRRRHAEESSIQKRQSSMELDRLSQYAAIELFCQRARMVKPDFALTTNNGPAVAELCSQLDGLPLAIELAAARIKLFSPQALLARVDQRLTLLKDGPHDQPERQRTLRNEIAWSYDLLADAEQALFRRLAVFVGSFSLEAALAVGNADGDPAIGQLDGLAALVDHNLLNQIEQAGNATRFGMLETIREYGLEQLEASGEAEAIRRRHAEFYLALAEDIALGVAPDKQGVGLTKLMMDYTNLRAALTWSQHSSIEREIVLRLTNVLIEFWLITGLWNEGRYWLERALTWTGTTERTAARAVALENAGSIAAMQGDLAMASKWLEEALAIATELGAKLIHAHALTALGWLAHRQQEYALAIERHRESLVIRRELGNKVHIASSLVHLADVLYDQHNYADAQSLYEEALTFFQKMEIEFEIADVIQRLGLVALRQLEYPRAWVYLQESLTRWRALGTLLWKGIPACLEGLAGVCTAQRKFVEAAHLFGAAETLQQALSPFFHNVTEDEIAALRLHLGESAFAAAWREGKSFSPEQAVTYALALPEIPESTSPPLGRASHAYPAGLTAREVEVLRLLAQGLTYAQIAAQLIITRRTVNGHVTSIYSKLGVNGRAAATRFAVEHHLL